SRSGPLRPPRVAAPSSGRCRSRTRHVPGTGLGRRSHVPGTVPRLTKGGSRADTRGMSAVPTTAARNAAEPLTVARTLAGRIALPLVFVAATTYHVLQSRGHATATVFNDELLYAKLSQAIAAGHGLSIRGEHIFFPAPLSSLVQAPAWLLGSMPNAYAAAKILNAVVMSAAVF